MTERIMTRHPDGKQGVNIAKDKYEAVEKAILALVDQAGGESALSEIRAGLGRELRGSAFEPEDSEGWYLMTVKLDLEARGVLERVPGVSPQRLRRPRAGKRR